MTTITARRAATRCYPQRRYQSPGSGPPAILRPLVWLAALLASAALGAADVFGAWA